MDGRKLDVSCFRNGDVIPEAGKDKEWAIAAQGIPAWCNYNNSPANERKYGKLYNWYAVNDPRGLAPEGWHIPTQAEFATLATTVNNNSDALKAIREGTGIGAGTNSSGFSALLTGLRTGDGTFCYLGFNTYFWSSEATYSATYNMYLALTMYLNGTISDIKFINVVQFMGACVRCIKD